MAGIPPFRATRHCCRLRVAMLTRYSFGCRFWVGKPGECRGILLCKGVGTRGETADLKSAGPVGPWESESPPRQSSAMSRGKDVLNPTRLSWSDTAADSKLSLTRAMVQPRGRPPGSQFASMRMRRPAIVDLRVLPERATKSVGGLISPGYKTLVLSGG